MVAVAAIGLASCVPIEQAPLVYTSKNQIGVGVSAGTPDSPGLDIAVGYKGLDAAYVPVALGRSCSSKSRFCADESSDTDGKHPITLVYGTNQVKGASRADLAMIENYQGQAKKFSEKMVQNNIVLDELVTARDNLAAITALENQQPPVIVDTDVEANQRKAKIEGLRAATSSLTKLDAPSVDKEILSIQNENKGLKGQMDTAYGLADDERQKLNRESADDKRDALSVYGSFNGTAGGNNSSASIALGKVFSTGIAAQNLTQGIRSGTVIAHHAICLDRLEDMAASMDVSTAKSGDALRKKADKICGQVSEELNR